MKNKNITDLVNDLDWFLSNIEDCDNYINTDPSLEEGFQLELYLYLKEQGYQVVYELELPNLQQYLEHELNENRVYGFAKGSLRPDIVVNLGTNGLACLELKYNESDINLCAKDLAKSRVYAKHCKDVHFAGFIHLHRSEIELDGFEGRPCGDEDYEYDFYGYTDNPTEHIGLSKSLVARPILSFWQNWLCALKRGEGKFAKFDYFE